MLPRLALTFALAVLLSPRAAYAQAERPGAPQAAVETRQYDTPAYVSVVDGSATLERDGRVENAPLNMPLLGGDRLRTANGRVEVRFADGGRLHLDSQTALDVQSDELVRLVDGRIRLSVQRAQQVNYRVDSAVGSVRVTQPGEYRVALIHGDRETQLELAVIRGAGEIFTEQGSTSVRSGERAYASAGLMPSYAYTYNSANTDEFDRWSEMQRGTVYAATSDSSQYLPPDMSGYASTFDQYGDWRYQQTYGGYVWYPHVATSWRPYYYGRWAPYPAYGWTWIPADPFGYPTHHYGRWGFSAGAWFWIPSPYWGPAYVSWGYAPNYVSWCPLGWNNVAVFSIGFYNVGPAYYAGHYHGHYYNAWTTMPHAYFGRGYPAHLHAVSWDRAGDTVARPQFTEARTGPATRDVAVPRSTAAPVRFAGTRAASGGGVAAGGRNLPPVVDTARTRDAGRSGATESPRYINRGDQIVRSQSERPIAPRPADTAIPRTVQPSAPSSSTPPRRTDAPFSPRDGHTGDTGYRPYDRAVPRTEPARGSTGGPGTQGPSGGRGQLQTTPRSDESASAARAYTRPYAGDRVYTNPYAGDRVYGRPSVGDRAYERPTVGDRASEGPYGGRVYSPHPMERPSTDAHGAPPAPGPPARSGGDHAVPRGGGGPGGTATRAPAAGPGAPAPHRGG